ncbi:hypothetical protein HDZ31DRAFT_39347 [Schizophyllum fasciatum]
MAPKKKGKSKSKKSAGLSGSKGGLDWSSIARDHEDLGDIDNAFEWSVIANVLCSHFNIPDLQTRRGLKKAHSEFTDISRRLEDAYEKGSGDWRLAGGIIAIYAKMCTDSILRNKVFGQKYLCKCLSLVDVEPCRHLVLRALATNTHHGGVEIRTEIAKSTTAKLVDLMTAHPEDRVLQELSISILAHCVSCLFSDPHRPPSDATLKGINLPRVLKQVVAALYKPYATSLIIDHAVDLLAMATLQASAAYTAVPSAFEFLVAGLNSENWAFRATCLGGIIRRYHREAESDSRHLDPHKLMSGIRNVPAHLRDIILDYGMQRSDMYNISQTSSEFQRAMMQVVSDRDLVGLGRKLVDFIQRTEFSIAEGAFQTQDPRTGRLELMTDLGLPFVMWGDALPHCAKALRAKGELDSADMLDIKFAIMRGRVPDAAEIGKRAILRNPQKAYFQYAISLVADRQVGLRACKKGLRCKETTPFVYFQLLQRAVEHAGDLGIMTLQEAPAVGDMHHDPDGARRYNEGIAFLMSAAEDAKTFVEEAPPDNRHMKSVLYWRILLTFLVRDKPIGPGMAEIQPLVRKLKVADEFSMVIGVPPPKTSLRLAQQAVLRHYPAAIEDWGHVIARTGGATPSAAQPESVADDLAAWLDDMHLEEGEDANPEHKHKHEKHERTEVKKSEFELYRCSYCRNPSAVLRKCGGCSKARYCDAECQKLGWPAHKKACKAAA